MSNYTTIRHESFVEEQKQVTLPQTQYTTKYTRSERPQTYQFWHKKGKQNSYSSRVLSTNYQLQAQQIPGQSILLGGCGQTQQCCTPCGQSSCGPQQQAVVRLGVVSREEIEAPWRDEVLYLQSLIAELEKKKEVQIVKEMDNTRVHELEDENERLRILIQQTKSEVITQRITEVNNEAEVWKKKFQEINHDYSETQEKLMNAEIELEALKKQKIVTTSSTVTKSVVKSSGSTVRQSVSGIKPIV
ncbi:unnamed protein product [Paramecium primaurelia]|uniref:Uncharacterized protein n=1 Tax=Paramecium primaurelia TaxID=5886 RepID=A0A8S1KGU4_PARPR|nr:unnamed protein product [Paramecium primaurelia]